MSLPVFGIVGWKNSGKTTLMASLIEHFSADLHVVAIKHAHHRFEIDQPNTDSGKFKAAGARQTVLVSETSWAIQSTENKGENLQTLLAKLPGYDLALAEGFKQSSHPKMWCQLQPLTNDERLTDYANNIIALASDADVEYHALPVFSPTAIAQIAAFIRSRLDL